MPSVVCVRSLVPNEKNSASRAIWSAATHARGSSIIVPTRYFTVTPFSANTCFAVSWTIFAWAFNSGRKPTSGIITSGSTGVPDFCTSQAAPLGPERHRLLGLVGLVGVGADAQLALAVGPLHQLGELLVDLGLLRLERLLDEDLQHLARLGGDLPLQHLAGEAVDGHEVAVLEDLALHPDGAGLVVD